MSGLTRRDALIAAAGMLVFPRVAAGQAGLQIAGSAAQGGLVIGRAGAASEVWVDGQPVRAKDGLFCFGFGRDAVNPAIVRVRYDGAREETREIAPQKRDFSIQRIDGLPEKFVTPPQAELLRIARDAKAVAEARLQDSQETWFSENFAWPARGPITGVYGSQRILNGEPRAPHYGLDIAAPAGTPIRAPLPGTVTLAEDLFLSGNTMILDHGHGVSTSYLHMSRMDAKPGDSLARGQQIGLVGQTGRATGPHLCWRLNWFQTRLDVALVAPPRAGDKA